MDRFILFFLFFHATRHTTLSLSITSPSHLAQHNIKAIFLNNHIGPQTRQVNISGELSWWEGDEAPTIVDCSVFNHTVAVVHSGFALWSPLVEQRTAVAFEDCGAIAVIRTAIPEFGGRGYLGTHATVRDANCCCNSESAVNIPLVNVWHADLPIETIKREPRITVDLTTVHPNPWHTDLHNHDFFRNYLMVVLPTMNVIVCALGLTVLRVQVQMAAAKNRQRKRQKNSLDHTYCLQWIAPVHIALFLEVTGCMIRATYCYLGPVEFNSYFTWEQHMFLGNISVPIEVMVVSIVAFTFQRVGALRRFNANNSCWGDAGTIILFFVSFVVVSSELVSGALRSARESVGTMLKVTGVLSFTFILVASLSFLFGGRAFLNKLRASRRLRQGECTHDKARRKFCAWIMLGALCRLCAMGVLAVLVAAPELYFTPLGFGVSWCSYYSAFTTAALCHILAFYPRVEARRRHSEVMEENKMADHRRASNGGSLPSLPIVLKTHPSNRTGMEAGSSTTSDWTHSFRNHHSFRSAAGSLSSSHNNKERDTSTTEAGRWLGVPQARVEMPPSSGSSGVGVAFFPEISVDGSESGQSAESNSPPQKTVDRTVSIDRECSNLSRSGSPALSVRSSVSGHDSPMSHDGSSAPSPLPMPRQKSDISQQGSSVLAQSLEPSFSSESSILGQASPPSPLSELMEPVFMSQNSSRNSSSVAIPHAMLVRQSSVVSGSGSGGLPRMLSRNLSGIPKRSSSLSCVRNPALEFSSLDSLSELRHHQDIA